MIRYKCRKCGATLESSSSLAGKEDKCPICGQVCIVPWRRAASSLLRKFTISGIAVVLIAVICLSMFLVVRPSSDSQKAVESLTAEDLMMAPPAEIERSLREGLEVRGSVERKTPTTRTRGDVLPPLVEWNFDLVFVNLKPGESGGQLADISLKPGEKISYSIAASKPVEIGILCVEAPVGGLVQLSQQGGGQASTSFWVSRLWSPTAEGLHLQVRNNATNDVRVILFEGAVPPSVQ